MHVIDNRCVCVYMHVIDGRRVYVCVRAVDVIATCVISVRVWKFDSHLN